MIKPNPDSCHLLLDSRLANEEVQKNPYTYNSIREVLSDGALNAATVEHPVTVYIAPGIYWLEDPQSEAVIVREDPKDLYPYGCKVNCANLKLVGLSENPEGVVIAANRGNGPWSEGELYSVPFFRGTIGDGKPDSGELLLRGSGLCIGSCAVCEKEDRSHYAGTAGGYECR